MTPDPMNLHIFVIEDDPDYAELLQYQLRRITASRAIMMAIDMAQLCSS